MYKKHSVPSNIRLARLQSLINQAKVAALHDTTKFSEKGIRNNSSNSGSNMVDKQIERAQ
jgi:hypothetical protein